MATERGNSNFFLQAFLKTYPLSCTSAVLSSDELKTQRKRDHFCYIVNHDPSYKEGSHFSTIIKKGNNLYYLDPLKLQTFDYAHIPLFLESFKECHYYELSAPIQAANSTFCGLFSLFFCYAAENALADLPFKPFYKTKLLENHCVVLHNLALVLDYYDRTPMKKR